MKNIRIDIQQGAINIKSELRNEASNIFTSFSIVDRELDGLHWIYYFWNTLRQEYSAEGF